LSKETINIEEITSFWLKSSNEDFTTMNNLYNSRDYSWALFVGHLVIEKLLKALFVKKHETQPPFIHDLLRLAKMTEIVISTNQSETLDALTNFNINTRYDDFKQAFKQTCTPEFTNNWIIKIKEMREWLLNQL
jgi:HEPN domain-containing protein